jgi:hypothetical protein
MIALYNVFFISRLWALFNDSTQQVNPPSVKAMSGMSLPLLLDERWLVALLPAMFVPTIIAFAYVRWMAWQFFKHN